MSQHHWNYLHRLLLFLCLCAAASSGWAQSTASLPPEVLAYADMVFYHGQILTVDEQFTIAEAVAVRDGKFLAVGDNQRILAMAGPKTRRVDLEDRTVVPGFMDTHLHSAWVTRPRGQAREEELNYETLETAPGRVTGPRCKGRAWRDDCAERTQQPRRES